MPENRLQRTRRAYETDLQRQYREHEEAMRNIMLGFEARYVALAAEERQQRYDSYGPVLLFAPASAPLDEQ